jgi:peptidoglycan/LPS O-acetylase OafA/YrhL
LTFDEYQRERYFAALDGVRALSIFAVVFHHATESFRWLNGGHGVTSFFVLSGFLITTLLLREEEANGEVSLAAFYIRRAFRILPLYYITLGIYCFLVVGLKLQPDRLASFRDALPYYALYFPEYVHFTGGGVPFEISWSLGIEEKFYAVWPLVSFVLLPGLLGRSLILVGLILGILFLPTSLQWARFVYPYASLAVGCLIGLILQQRVLFERLRWFGRYPGIFLAVAALTIVGFGTESSIVVAVACGAALIALILSAPLHTLTTHMLASRPAVFVGQCSYEIYLLHQLVLNALRTRFQTTNDVESELLLAVAGFATSVIAAAIVHRAVGQPLVRWGRAVGRRYVKAGSAA